MIGSWLGATSGDGSGAHVRYNSYPKGWSVLECRSKMVRYAENTRLLVALFTTLDTLVLASKMFHTFKFVK